MSDVIIPDVEITSDVLGAEAAEMAEPAVNYSEKTLAELVTLFEELMQNEDRMKMSKEAEALKAAFYKRLQKEKADAGYSAPETVEGEEPEEMPEVAQDSPFAVIEAGFKEQYNKYKRERAEYNKALEKEREDNLAQKEAVIADLKALLEKQEDVNATFPAFREIQERWRAIGPVPAQSYRNVTETYQLYVEQFYDMVKINRELRDLDFKKNLEAKEQLCNEAEALAEQENVVEAFRELQKLHEQWKEYGPVAKEFRESIWERFKAATAVINKKYQAHFEGIKEQQAENLAKKTLLCEKVEEIAAREIADSNEWNACSKEIEDIQKEWRTIGFASKKDNQKIYDRFRAACDYFFAERDKHAKPENDYYGNLKAKMRLIEEIKAYELKGDESDQQAMQEFQKRWQEIGFVPFKEKDNIAKAYKEAMAKFATARPQRKGRGGRQLSEQERLIQKYHQLEQDIVTYENNIGFFSMSKASEPLIRQMEQRIADAKAELEALAAQIRELAQAKEQE